MSDRPGSFPSRLTCGNDHEETRNKINFGKARRLLPSLEGTEPSNLHPIATEAARCAKSRPLELFGSVFKCGVIKCPGPAPQISPKGGVSRFSLTGR